MMTKRSNLWANYNGPGKPITEQQLAKLLATVGIKERFDENGNGYYTREDFVTAWVQLGLSK